MRITTRPIPPISRRPSTTPRAICLCPMTAT